MVVDCVDLEAVLERDYCMTWYEEDGEDDQLHFDLFDDPLKNSI